MATSTSSVRSLVDSQAILYIRESVVRCTLSDVRPNTRLYVFFDSVDVTAFCAPGHTDTTYPSGLPAADREIVSDAAGRANFSFFISGGTYRTGTKTITVSDVADLELLKIGGNVYGSATAVYTTKGTQEVYQTVTTHTTTIENFVTQTYSSDPLAQSFFTYGAKGGIFVTAIELFFQAKDTTMPVWVELREMINGYPAPMKSNSTDLVSTLLPFQVNTSSDSSVGTVFRFPVPVYLAEDKDYCFVVAANTGKYTVFTSAMGERSLETDTIIFEQPYTGSMFKSQNNSTWTAEQFEDVKFNIYKAEFKTASGNLTLVGSAPTRLYKGERFYTTNGSSKVILKGLQQHGLSVGDTITVAAEELGSYNGIPGTSFNGHRNVTRVIDDYVVEFDVGADATSTGNILTSGKVFSVAVLNPGSGYTTAPLVTIAAPASGTQATATAEVYDGKITRIIVTNNGSGYTTQPAVLIGGVGVGASAAAPIDVTVLVTTNKPTHVISPQIRHSVVQDTGIDAKLRLTNPSYGFSPEQDIVLSAVTDMSSGDQKIASRQNEFARMSNDRSVRLDMLLRTTNPNVSPVIDARAGLNLLAYTSAINDLSAGESVDSVQSSSGVVGYTALYGGSGYAGVPLVEIIPAENDRSTNIVPATATATISLGVITDLTITPGSGYTKPPSIVIAPPTAGTQATAQALIDVINSEINNRGNAYSRYITKKISLASTSTAVKLTSYLYSLPTTNVDWYIRTSLSGDATQHDENPWRVLKCDIPRDKSTRKNQYFDYEFTLLDLPEFDTYDLKCVLSSTNPIDIPFIKNYRVVVAA
jgi:hypothetical protein